MNTATETQVARLPRTLTAEGFRMPVTAVDGKLRIDLSAKAAKATGNDGWGVCNEQRELWQSMRTTIRAFAKKHGYTHVEVLAPVQTAGAGIQTRNVDTFVCI